MRKNDLWRINLDPCNVHELFAILSVVLLHHTAVSRRNMSSSAGVCSRFKRVLQPFKAQLSLPDLGVQKEHLSWNIEYGYKVGAAQPVFTRLKCRCHRHRRREMVVCCLSKDRGEACKLTVLNFPYRPVVRDHNGCQEKWEKKNNRSGTRSEVSSLHISQCLYV